MGEVGRSLLGGQVKIGENDDSRRGMFEDLGAPSRLFSSVEPLAKNKAELLE